MAETEIRPFERFNDALRNLDDQIHDFRERVDERRKKLEHDVRERAERARRDVESQVKKSSLYKRADRVRKDVEERVEKVREDLYDAFGIASKSELERINRKLTAISRKLNEIAKEHAREASEL